MPPNRLAAETSLYLRQHANNPVDWFPWGPEALARARELDRPIFLSIGYSACHWCHVMEHESFEDAATAAVLNEHFVSIKVDREERPDLDAIYMSALQLLTREGGGWPLNVFLAPDLTPFFAGTYYPPDNRYAHHGKPSFRRLLASIVDAWTTRRDRIAEVGRDVAEQLGQTADLTGGDRHLSDDVLRAALAALERNFDPVNGGFGSAPKFPHALELRVLFRLAHRFADPRPLTMARRTLDQMARGGMYDQLGGGFARYSTDERWLVPHFEKMLYDNALLATAYVEGWQLTRDPFYEQIARETLDYVWDAMTSDGGAFFSTEDADSEGEEGKFYVWSAAEVRAALGPELGAFACRVWGVTLEGNFEGHNILFRARPDADDAQRLGLSAEDFRAKLAEAKEKLWAVRDARVHPARDEKILTAWNGLMISAFAKAGAAFGDDDFTTIAANAADWCLDHLRDEGGRLFRTADADGNAKLAGYLEDYAFLADALVTLAEATGEVEYVREAVALADAMLTHFSDPAGAGFFTTADDHEALIARMKESHDGSTPSGTSVAVTALLRLGKLTGRRDFTEKAEATLRAYRGTMAEHPTALGQMLVALDFHLGPVDEVAVVGSRDAIGPVLAELRGRFRPHQVLAVHDPACSVPGDVLPLLADRPAVGGEPTVYVCRDGVCAAPLVGLEAVRAYARPERERPS